MSRLIIALVVITVSGISTWLLKMKLKKRMERGLGRKVDDSELTSINAWMKVPSKDQSYKKDKVI